MLNRIRIKNFRCCKDVTIDGIGAIAVLVGRNGTGKTSALEAIALAARAASSPSFDVGRDYGFDKTTSVALEFEAFGQSYTYEMAYHHEFAKNELLLRIKEKLSLGPASKGKAPLLSRNNEDVQIEGRPSIRIGLSAAALPAIAALLPLEDEIVSHINSAIGFLWRIRYYPPHETARATAPTSGIIAEKEFIRWQERFEAGQPVADSVVFRIIHLFKNKAEEFARLKQYLGQNDLSVVDDIHVVEYSGGNEKNADRYFACQFIPSNSHSIVDFDSLSFGTQRVIRIVSAAISDNSTVMLIEQPEDGIHSGLMKKLVDVLRELSDPAQLLITSHSSDVFNRMRPEEIKLFSIRDDYTHVRGLTAVELRAAAKYLGSDGPLSDFIEMVGED